MYWPQNSEMCKCMHMCVSATHSRDVISHTISHICTDVFPVTSLEIYICVCIFVRIYVSVTKIYGHEFRHTYVQEYACVYVSASKCRHLHVYVFLYVNVSVSKFRDIVSYKIQDFVTKIL